MDEARRATLEFRGVAKTYRTVFGRHRALDDCSFEVGPGEIVGLVGANGAGKTTLIHLLLGYLHADRGSIRAMGRPPGDVHARSEIGWVADRPIFSRKATAASELDAFLAGHGWSPERRAQHVRPLLARWGLADAADRGIASYSLGMQQKVSLMLAWSHRPKLLVLDEPFSALDASALRHVRTALAEFRTDGGSVLVSSHHLPELETVCDRALFLSGGKIEREQRLDRDTGAARIHIVLDAPAEARAALERERPAWLTDWALADHTLTGTIDDRDRVPELIALLVRGGARVRGAFDEGLQLERIFAELENRQP